MKGARVLEATRMLAWALLGWTLLLGGCAGLDAARARGEVRIVKSLGYVEGSVNPRHRLDLYLPAGRTGFPVVLFVHGGYWTGGDRHYYAGLTGLYGNLGIALARQGIGVAVQSYRIHPEVRIDGELEDVARAARWVHDHIGQYGGDASRFFLAGHSAGGHLVSLMATDPRYLEAAGLGPAAIRGVVAMSGILDVEHMADHKDAEFNAKITHPVFGTEREAWRRYSPRTWFRAGLPPFLILIGTEDYPVILDQTPGIVESLRQAGNSPAYVRLEGFTHEDIVLTFGRRGDRQTSEIVKFIHAATP